MFAVFSIMDSSEAPIVRPTKCRRVDNLQRGDSLAQTPYLHDFSQQQLCVGRTISVANGGSARLTARTVVSAFSH